MKERNTETIKYGLSTPVENPKSAFLKILGRVNASLSNQGDETDLSIKEETKDQMFLTLLDSEENGAIHLYDDKKERITSKNLDACVNGCSQTVANQFQKYLSKVYLEDDDNKNWKAELLDKWGKNLSAEQTDALNIYSDEEEDKVKILLGEIQNLSPEQIEAFKEIKKEDMARLFGANYSIVKSLSPEQIKATPALSSEQIFLLEPFLESFTPDMIEKISELSLKRIKALIETLGEDTFRNQFSTARGHHLVEKIKRGKLNEYFLRNLGQAILTTEADKIEMMGKCLHPDHVKELLKQDSEILSTITTKMFPHIQHIAPAHLKYIKNIGEYSAMKLDSVGKLTKDQLKTLEERLPKLGWLELDLIAEKKLSPEIIKNTENLENITTPEEIELLKEIE